MTSATDQASRLRSLMHERQRDAAPLPPARSKSSRAHVIAIASGKGGVGKTSLAVNLAISLAEAGRETALLDGDLGLGNSDIMCGLSPGRNLGSVLRGERTLDDVAVRYRPRLRLIPCGSGVAGMSDPDSRSRVRLAEAFAGLERSASVVLIDCGAGLGPMVLDLVALADTTLVVTTPEPTSIADAYGLLKSALTREQGPRSGVFRLVVNQCRGRAEGEAVHARIAAVCDRFLGYRLSLAGTVLADTRVGQSVRERRPLVLSHPRSDSARDVLALCGSVLRWIDGDDRATAGSEGVLSRLWSVITRTG